MEYLKTLIPIAGMMVTGFLTYHRFVMYRIDKKVDQILHDKELEWLKVQIKHNYANLEKRIDNLTEDTKIIKEHILNKK